MDRILDYSLKTCSPANVGPKLPNSVSNTHDVRNPPVTTLHALNQLNSAFSSLIKQQQGQPSGASSMLHQSPLELGTENPLAACQQNVPMDSLLMALTNLRPELSPFAALGPYQQQQSMIASHLGHHLSPVLAQSLISQSLFGALNNGGGGAQLRTAEEALSPPSIFDTLRLLANGQRGGDSQVDLEPPPAKRTKPSTDDISKPIFLPVTPAKRPQSLVQALNSSTLMMSPLSHKPVESQAFAVSQTTLQNADTLPPLPSPPLSGSSQGINSGMLGRHSSMTSSSCVSSTQNSPVSSSKSQHSSHSQLARRLSITHSNGGGTSSSSSTNRTPQRKPAAPIPVEKKDEAYYERRQKNNEAAKRSRDQRRQKEEQTAQRANYLEQENLQLRTHIAQLNAEINKLRTEILAKGNAEILAMPSLAVHNIEEVLGRTLFAAQNTPEEEEVPSSSSSSMAEEKGNSENVAKALLLLKDGAKNESNSLDTNNNSGEKDGLEATNSE